LPDVHVECRLLGRKSTSVLLSTVKSVYGSEHSRTTCFASATMSGSRLRCAGNADWKIQSRMYSALSRSKRVVELLSQLPQLCSPGQQSLDVQKATQDQTISYPGSQPEGNSRCPAVFDEPSPIQSTTSTSRRKKRHGRRETKEFSKISTDTHVGSSR
jgi:hypothetical protein